VGEGDIDIWLFSTVSVAIEFAVVEEEEEEGGGGGGGRGGIITCFMASLEMILLIIC